MLACSFLIETSSVAGNLDRHKSLYEFDFGLDQTTHFVELLAIEWRKFYTFELEYLWGQLANLDQIWEWGKTA